MVYSALTIAEYVLYYAKMKGYGLSSLQLLKILYFVQAQFLVFKKTPAFADKMTAASWGPDVKSVWDRYSAYGNAFIPVVNDNVKSKILTEDAKLIEEVEDLLLGFSNSSLLDRSRSKKGGGMHLITKSRTLICRSSLDSSFFC